ncbi:ATP-dependent helicase HrpB [Algivirga pacifica]|uniref:ATP-dependent helicase HrpB n=1 Tax=Algivirga pacifica TaxID=1162670 RepID=A0ABP9DG10_9BACT
MEVVPEVKELLQTNTSLILKAPPGAGKSTILPLMLMEETWLKGKKILMLEPRRLAAKSIASRMAELLEEPVGQRVGYRIRFEQKVSQHTQIEVLTEGILTRMLQSDNALEGVGLVIFDEFHERSLNADLALALCRESQQILREDLRVLIMSATLDMSKLSSLLHAPVVESQGKMYPVNVQYTGESDPYLLPEMTAKTVKEALQKNEGDILVFLPGQGEIKKCEGLLKHTLPKDIAILPLYGQLPMRQQHAAIFPHKEGKRKVVLATSIAETSLTIEGIKVVIDTGYGRYSQFDPNTGLSRLTTERISKDAAEQRKGRAGRLSEGTCYRMWTAATHERLSEHRMPEIEQADLADLVLDMAQWGIEDPQDLTWLTPPPNGSMAQAQELLHQLEAMEDGVITEHGKNMHQLPCHPRVAHMLLEAEDMDLLPLATDLAAILEERDFLGKEAGINVNLRIEALRRYRKEKGQGKKLGYIEKIAANYRKLFNIDAENGLFDEYETGLLLAFAYPERIACSRPGNNAQFQLANGRIAAAGHRDELAHESWLAVAHLDARDGLGKIFLASPLNPKDLAPMVKEVKVITWDTEDGGLIATKDLRIGNIILKSTPLNEIDEEERILAICDALKKEGEQLLPFDKEVEAWQARVLSLRIWRPAEKWPDVSTPTLLRTCQKWLSPYLKDIRKPQDLKKLPLMDILEHSLEWEQQNRLSEVAPERIEVPSGSKIKIQYQANGSQPILAVRLQEVFGMTSTPHVNDGKVALLMHLLSPGFKPVQVTSDLHSFWENTYHEVKKELKRRYPKHSWPEDPWSAEAVRGVKRKKIE